MDNRADPAGFRLYDGKPSILPPCDRPGCGQKMSVVRGGVCLCAGHARAQHLEKFHFAPSDVRVQSPGKQLETAVSKAPFQDEDDERLGWVSRLSGLTKRSVAFDRPPSGVESGWPLPGRGRPRKVDPRE